MVSNIAPWTFLSYFFLEKKMALGARVTVRWLSKTLIIFLLLRLLRPFGPICFFVNLSQKCNRQASLPNIHKAIARICGSRSYRHSGKITKQVSSCITLPIIISSANSTHWELDPSYRIDNCSRTHRSIYLWIAIVVLIFTPIYVSTRTRWIFMTSFDSLIFPFQHSQWLFAKKKWHKLMMKGFTISVALAKFFKNFQNLSVEDTQESHCWGGWSLSCFPWRQFLLLLSCCVQINKVFPVHELNIQQHNNKTVRSLPH